MVHDDEITKETIKIIQRLKKEITTYLDFVLSKKNDHEVAELIDYLDHKKIFNKKSKLIKKNLIKSNKKKLQ